MEPISSKDQLGRYQLVQSLGKGGMGEVFLAYDPICKRQVALKRIRLDLTKHISMRNRFLREAHITASLTHPSIIPIFSIEEQQETAYYTMPYVEGETLKALLLKTREQEKKGEELNHVGGSIPLLVRIFLTVCQGIAYCHSKGVLHRDIKPDNIILGKYGEVLIADWGLADYIDHPLEEIPEEIAIKAGLTRPGKVVGTYAYMAPERLLDEPATAQTDLYSLGVILYQLLTLRLPFHRPDLAHFRKMLAHEELIDPIERAPYREIPPQLSAIVTRCLQPLKEKRYRSVQALIEDLENYIEGRSEWIPIAELHMENKEDWEFQENVPLAKHTAITRNLEGLEWVNLMISKQSFAGNTRIEAQIAVSPSSSGVGLLLCIPDREERKGIDDGYCLWIGTPVHPHTTLFRSNVQLVDLPDLHLPPDSWHQICLEKTDNHLRFFLDGVLKCNYISHTPLVGTHIGLLSRDGDFQLKSLKVCIGSQNVMVNCLSVPDAFLAGKEFDKALTEYRRIASSFPGRSEGSEAQFRAGITLIEEAVSQKKKKTTEYLLMTALDEFSKLRYTPGAPLEYLGKSLVYRATKEIEEEVKCLELAVRKYSKHPLFPRLVDHVIFRLHESASHERLAAYHFALLALCHLPFIFSNPDHQKLLSNLTHHWEKLPFIDQPSQGVTVQLAFFLAKPITLLERIEKNDHVEDALFALLELGCYQAVQENPRILEFQEPGIALTSHEKGLEQAFSEQPKAARTWNHLFQTALDTNRADLVLSHARPDLIHWKIAALLSLKNWKEAGQLFKQLPQEQLSDESSPFYWLFGCYLWATKGKPAALAHFSSVVERPYPPTTALLAHYLTGRINLKTGWITKAFVWEKMELYRQLALFFVCTKQPKQSKLFQTRLKKELMNSKS